MGACAWTLATASLICRTFTVRRIREVLTEGRAPGPPATAGGNAGGGGGAAAAGSGGSGGSGASACGWEARLVHKPLLRRAMWALATRVVLARRWMLAVLALELLLVKGAYLLVTAATLAPWQAALAILVASLVTALPDVLPLAGAVTPAAAAAAAAVAVPSGGSGDVGSKAQTATSHGEGSGDDGGLRASVAAFGSVIRCVSSSSVSGCKCCGGSSGQHAYFTSSSSDSTSRSSSAGITGRWECGVVSGSQAGNMAPSDGPLGRSQPVPPPPLLLPLPQPTSSELACESQLRSPSGPIDFDSDMHAEASPFSSSLACPSPRMASASSSAAPMSPSTAAAGAATDAGVGGFLDTKGRRTVGAGGVVGAGGYLDVTWRSNSGGGYSISSGAFPRCPFPSLIFSSGSSGGGGSGNGAASVTACRSSLQTKSAPVSSSGPEVRVGRTQCALPYTPDGGAASDEPREPGLTAAVTTALPVSSVGGASSEQPGDGSVTAATAVQADGNAITHAAVGAASGGGGASATATATITSIRRLSVPSVLVRRSPLRAKSRTCPGGIGSGTTVAATASPAATCTPAVVVRADSGSGSGGAKILTTYKPVSRTRLISVKVYTHPGPFGDYAPTACERIHDYLRANPLPLRSESSTADGGGAADGGGGGGAVLSIGAKPSIGFVKTMAVQGCVQVVSWVHTIPHGRGGSDAAPSGDGGGGGGGSGGGDGALRDGGTGGADGGGLARGLVGALPHAEVLPAVDVGTGGVVASFRRSPYGGLADASSGGLAQVAPSSAGADDEGPEVSVLWVRPPFLAAADAGGGTTGADESPDAGADAVAAGGMTAVEVCLAVADRRPSRPTMCPRAPPPAGTAVAAAAAAETHDSDGPMMVVRLLLVTSDPWSSDRVLLDEHAALERGAASVVKLRLPAPTDPGVIRVVVASPAAHYGPSAAATHTHGQPLIYASSTVLSLPSDAARELCELTEAAAASRVEIAATDDANRSGGGSSSSSGAVANAASCEALSHTWTNLVAPIATDVAFLVDCAAALSGGSNGAARPSAASATAAAFHMPLCMTTPAGWAAGRAALLGLLAVEDSLRSALEPLGAPATTAYISDVSRRAAASLLATSGLAAPRPVALPPQPSVAVAVTSTAAGSSSGGVAAASDATAAIAGAAAAVAVVGAVVGAGFGDGLPSSASGLHALLGLGASGGAIRRSFDRPASAAAAAAAAQLGGGGPRGISFDGATRRAERGGVAAAARSAVAAASGAAAEERAGSPDSRVSDGSGGSAPASSRSSCRSVERPPTPGPHARRAPVISTSYRQLLYGKFASAGAAGVEARMDGDEGAVVDDAALDEPAFMAAALAQSRNSPNEVDGSGGGRLGAGSEGVAETAAAAATPARKEDAASAAVARRDKDRRSGGAEGAVQAASVSEYAAAVLSRRRRLLMAPLTGFRYVEKVCGGPVNASVNTPSGGGGSSSGGSCSACSAGAVSAATGRQAANLERQYELYCNVVYHGIDLAAFAMLMTMFSVVTWRKLWLPAAMTARGVYNLTMLWVVASTLMMPYVVQLVRRGTYERHREQLHLAGQAVNGLVYCVFALQLLPMPPEMTFHWNHSHVLQRGLVRPVRRPGRFSAHLRMMAIEVCCLTPAFLAYSGWRRTFTTTLVTYSMSASVGYALDLAMRRVFLLSLGARGRSGGRVHKEE